MSTRTLSRSHRLDHAPVTSCRLVRQLSTEWQQLHGSTAASAQLTQWGHTALAELERPGDVLDRIDASDNTDEILGELVRLHQAGDPLAGRVLLQAMLPALITRARRCRLPREVDDFEARVQVAVTAFWSTISRLRTGPRVCQRLTLNTVNEMTYWSRVGVRGHEWEDRTDLYENVDDVDRSADPSPTTARPGDHIDADSDLLEVLMWATKSGVLNKQDAQLLADTYLSGTSTADHNRAAARADIQLAACRKRVQRARKRLTTAVCDYAADQADDEALTA